MVCGILLVKIELMNQSNLTAKQHALALCSGCHHLVKMPVLKTTQRARCSLCGENVRYRKTHTIARTWALVITGFMLLIPANVLPIMTVVYFGRGEPDTIMSGVIHLAQADMYPIAILVFVASVFVPLVKLLGLIVLLLVVQFKLLLNARQCSVMYRMIEFIGRWSMLDLFMISILVTLVDRGAITSVTAGPGATAFAAVVVTTMVAASTFDVRLIWDLREKSHDRG